MSSLARTCGVPLLIREKILISTILSPLVDKTVSNTSNKIVTFYNQNKSINVIINPLHMRKLIVSCCLASLLMLTSCVNIIEEIFMKKDGSGNFKVITAGVGLVF